MTDDKMKICIDMLNSELMPALGCTEPIAIAYASAKAREILGEFPDKLNVYCSGNIIKNVKGVIVPTTVNMKGVDTSAVIGVVGGNPSKQLEVLSEVTKEDVEKTRGLLGTEFCKVFLEKGVSNLYIKVEAIKDENKSIVEIVDGHTNIVTLMKNNEEIFKKNYSLNGESNNFKSIFTVKELYEFANTVDISKVHDVIKMQIDYNMKIAEEGLTHKYGASVGNTILNYSEKNVANRAKAYVAAGSDARMGGCVLPVIINSGSGNQGMTVSIPVIVYANHLEVPEEKLYRALIFSNLVALYQKSGIGKLSAYCGAVSAACGSGAAIAYLYDEPFEVIGNTIKNVLGNVSGIVCDGAKASCAAKIASSVDAAIMGYNMAKTGHVFESGEGLIVQDLDKTVSNICKVAKEGMKETDVEILQLMIEE
ncbi:MAG: serine dehydratase subunit alpha family protein [Lachnospirales bacterium]